MSERLARGLLVAVALLAPAGATHAAGKKYALLVGVNKYQHDALAELKYAENDVDALGKVLKGADYEVVVLTAAAGEKDATLAPTAKNVRARLKAVAERSKAEDVILVALSGHGVRLADESFFCPSDAEPEGDAQLDELKKTLIPFRELFGALGDAPAEARLLLADVSRHPAKGKLRNVEPEALPPLAKGAAALFGCRSGERGYETGRLGEGHGLFFYHVIHGLQGEAVNRKGQVTWSSLAEHVSDKVAEDAPRVIGKGAKQTPYLVEKREGVSLSLLPGGDDAGKPYRDAVDLYYGRTKKIDRPRALKLFLDAGKRGHALALGYAAFLLHQGEGAKADRAEAAKKVAPALEAIREQARGGGAEAQALLGLLYLVGLDVDRDEKEAARWFGKAADQDNLEGVCNLGLAYETGRGVEKDDKRAAELYRKAALAGDPTGMYHLAALYAGGRGTRKDDGQALLWYRKAAAQGHPTAAYAVGLAYENGRGVKQDFAEAHAWYLKAAELGEDQAMTSLGMMYVTGVGVEKKDEKEAVKWLEKAARKGRPEAMTYLGLMYTSGRGVKQDNDKAVEWFRKAAEKDHAEGMTWLGLMYANGLGVEKDDRQAVKLFRKAAEKGSTAAMVELGARHAGGLGVEKDQEKAVEWYRKAAEKDDALGAYLLGAACLEGKGVERDDKEAVRWFRKAALKNHAPSMALLGLCYEVGRGVTKDVKEAARWYKKSAALGNENAKKRLKELEGDGEAP